MAYKLTWYQPNRIIFAVVSGDITIAEVHHASAALTELLNSAAGRVYLIADLSAVTGYPGIALDLFRASTYVTHPRMHGVILFGLQSRLAQTILNIFGSLTKARFKLVASLDVALALVETWDARRER
jgi:anti-anti-sigma regulatory factor